MTRQDATAPSIQAAPNTFRGALRHIGPGIIISANIVGSGELIVTTQLGASAGFILLWFILFSCFIKVFVQIEIGRYTISEGRTSLDALNRMPGPRLIVSWVLWLWLLMFLGLFFQMSGMIGSLASLVSPDGPAHVLTAILAAGSCAVLLAVGRYRIVERLSTVMVALFTIGTVAALVALQWTVYRVTGADLAEGLALGTPASFTMAFAAFGVTGIGAGELLYYPYWCLEKGYARHVGPRDDTPQWQARARGWIRVLQIDAWVSMAIYTIGTVAFYLLGASVLHARGLKVSNTELVPALSQMYRDAFGPIGLYVFLLGAFMVLYSTVFVSTASNARLLSDAAGLFRILRFRDAEHRARVTRAACVAIPVIVLVIALVFRAPVTLVLIGALGQALMLPFLGLAAVWFRHRVTHPVLRSGVPGTLLLWGAFASFCLLGAYQAWTELARVVSTSSGGPTG